MTDRTTNAIDAYLDALFAPDDPVLADILARTDAAGMRHINVPPMLGRVLGILIRATGARRVVEIGTLGGYSATWMARALPPDGRIISLEVDPHHAAVARSNWQHAGVAEKIEVRVGRAIDLLPALSAEGPCDLVFIDADKSSYPDYLAWAVAHVRIGGVIVADNVLRGGRVAHPDPADADAVGMARFNEMAAREPRLDAVIIPNRDGRDGFLLATLRPVQS